MDYEKSVFLNCPFDDKYTPLFRAAIFSVIDCGFEVRCGLETSDASQIRIQKIYEQIGSCKFGIHDLSRVQIDENSQLPRFNMPLELGVFLGAKFLGNARQKQKMCLVFDEIPYRYQKYLSDIAGQDISSHGNSPQTMITEIRNWLSNISSQKLPSGSFLWARYQRFQRELKGSCNARNQNISELTYSDFLSHLKEFAIQKVDALKTGYKNRWGDLLNDPPLAHIKEAITKLKGGTNSFVILTKGGNGHSFLQVHGCDTDGFELQYQDGSIHDHYECTDKLTEAEVIEVFQRYKNGDECWKTDYSWKKYKWW